MDETPTNEELERNVEGPFERAVRIWEYLDSIKNELNRTAISAQDVSIEVQIPVNKIYRAYQLLTAMGNIVLFKRNGGSFTPSTYTIVSRPVRRDYLELQDRAADPSGFRTPSRSEKNAKSILALNSKITQLEARIAQLEDLVDDHIGRCSALPKV